MDYQRIYNEFIADRRGKEANLIASGEYKERHHIVPRSLGGTDDASNMIALTAGDHYFAHLCLAKAYGGAQWNGVEAMANMRGSSKRRAQFSARYMVAIARKKAAVVHSKNAKAMHTNGQMVNAQSPEAQAKRAKTMIGKNYGWAEARILGIKAAAQRGTYSSSSKKMWAVMSEAKKSGFSERMIERNKSNNPSQTEEGRAKIKEHHNRPEVIVAKRARMSGENNPTRQISVRNKIAEKCALRDMSKNGRQKSVVNLNTLEVFSSIAEAREHIAFPKAKISEVCNGRRKTAGGFRWAYA